MTQPRFCPYAGCQRKFPRRLRRCPFCGGVAELRQISAAWQVQCAICGISTEVFESKAGRCKAMRMWNRRHARH